jgi:hypothetical protein
MKRIVEMTPSEMLLLSDTELEERKDPKVKTPIGAYEQYIYGLTGLMEIKNITLEKAIERTVKEDDEHTVFFVKAFQHLKGRGNYKQ